MHISEGILSAPVLGAGVALAAGGVALGLKRVDYDGMPKVAVLSAAFFVASLIHVPLGPSSVHLVLNGLLGIMLGWVAFPAIFVGLLLQAVLFQYGGFTTLGINTINMALPAVLSWYLFRRPALASWRAGAALAGFACGFLSVALSCVLVALSLVAAEEAFLAPAKLILVAHLPVMVVEGIITAFIIAFLRTVKPELLEAP